MTTSLFDLRMERVSAGERLTADEIRELAATPDILPLGMLADAWRRRVHGTRTTFLRVAECPFDRSFADSVPPTAREIRITGAPDTLDLALAAIETARSVAGDRGVTGFGWSDVERFAGGEPPRRVLERLRAAGLDALADVPVDQLADVEPVLRHLRDAGYGDLRLSIARLGAADRVELLLRVGALQDDIGGIASFDPLPSVLHAFRPTTGYDDVKMMAVARLAAPTIPSMQVNWPRYGPKLAQVALTFGADDVYGVSASDDAPEGRRRAPLEEIRRNVEAAGFEPVERDARRGR